MRKFAHLHVHTIFSISDALGKSKEYVHKMHKFNYEHGDEYFVALAITDHSGMYGVLKHKEACEVEIQITQEDKVRTIKPIYGVETYHSLNDTKSDPKTGTKAKRMKEKEEGVKVDDRTTTQSFHLVLLAKNNEGYYNTVSICSHGGLNSYTAIKPFYRTDLPYMKDKGKGIIALSGCIGGYIPQLLLNGEYDKAKERALEFNNMFEHFYLELQANIIPEQLILNQLLLKLSNDTGIDIVITNDIHYVDKEDRPTHDILYSMSDEDNNKKKKKDDDKKKTRGIDDYVHLKTPIEIEEYCNQWNIPLKAMDNTVVIANMCEVDFSPPNSKFYMPKFKVPNGYTEESYLEYLTYNGLYDNIMDKGIADTLEVRLRRLNHELDVINNAGFAGYFLLVSDFIQKCKNRGIYIGPGRGSAAGAIISYILKITNIDPIKYNFLFSRFLNPERVSMPD